MDNKILYLIFILFLSSCSGSKKKEITYYNNGNIKSIVEKKNDASYEIVSYFYENGNLEKKMEYRNGVAYGDVIQYYRNGKVDILGYFINDKKYGWFHKYDSLGNLVRQSEFLFVYPNGNFFDRIDTTNISQKVDYENQFITYKKDGEIDTLNSSFFTINGKKGNDFNTIYGYIGEPIEITIELVTPKFKNGKIDFYLYNNKSRNETDSLFQYSVKGNRATISVIVYDELYGIEGCLLETSLDAENHYRGYFVFQPINGKKRNSP